jgi:threonyl-tRNA synthetase
LTARLRQERIRVELDARNEKIGLKIREAQLQHVPYMLVVGDKEAAAGAVSLRTRKQGDQGSLAQNAAITRIRDAVASRAHEG